MECCRSIHTHLFCMHGGEMTGARGTVHLSQEDMMGSTLTGLLLLNYTRVNMQYAMHSALLLHT